MKIYTFKNTHKSTKSNSSYAKSMNAEFFKKILEFAPYLKDDNDTPSSNTTEYVFINKKKPTKSTMDKTIMFINAAKFLSDYNKRDNYDFTLDDGTRVTIYDDEIQIGYDFIPKTLFSDIDFINSLSPKTKNNIIEISIKINR